MGQDQVSGGVSVLCWLAAPVAMFYGNLQNSVIRSKSVLKSSSVISSQIGVMSEKKSIHTINKIKIKMLSRRSIEPTPTDLEAGIQVELVTCILPRGNWAVTLRDGLQEEWYFNGLWFHFRDSAFLTLVKLQKTMPSWSRVSVSASIIYSFGPPFYASLVLLQAGLCFHYNWTGKHRFEMQKVWKELA